MRLLVGYVIHEITDDLASRLCLSMISLDACTEHHGVILFCRPEIYDRLPQLGVRVCVVPHRIGQEEALEQGAASHQVVVDHGCDALFLLEPSTIVLKDIVRDAMEMTALRIASFDDETTVINTLAVDNPKEGNVIERDALPLIISPCKKAGGVRRWICGYTYMYGEGGWNVVRGSNPGLCIVKGGISDMAMAIRSFHIDTPIVFLPSSSSSSETTHPVRYYAVLLESRPERVAIVDDMKKALPEGSLTVVGAVDGRKELDAARLSALTLSGFLEPLYYDAYVPDRPMLVNTVASFMSHVRALKRLVEDLETDGNPNAVGVILEDDVRFLVPFHRKIVDTCRAVWWEEGGSSADVVQMFVMPMQRIFVNPIVRYGQRRPRHDEHVVIRSPESNWGMQCYMMRLEGAKKLLEGFAVMRGAADEQISRIPGLDLRCLVGPPILEEDTTNAPSVTQAKSASTGPLYVKDLVYRKIV